SSDVPRLVANSVALLGAEGAAPRVAALMENRTSTADPPQMLFMLRKRPFTAAESAQLAGWDLAKPLIVPGYPVPEPYTELLNGRKSIAEWEAASPTRVGAVFDDSTFYFVFECSCSILIPIPWRPVVWHR